MDPDSREGDESPTTAGGVGSGGARGPFGRPRFVDTRTGGARQNRSSRTDLRDLLTETSPRLPEQRPQKPDRHATDEAMAMGDADKWPVISSGEGDGSPTRPFPLSPGGAWEGDEDEGGSLDASFQDRESVGSCPSGPSGRAGSRSTTPSKRRSMSGGRYSSTARQRHSIGSCAAASTPGGGRPSSPTSAKGRNQQCGTSPRRASSLTRVSSLTSVASTSRLSMSQLPTAPDGGPDRPKGDVSVCVRLRPGPRHEMCIFAETANCVRMRPYQPSSRSSFSGSGGYEECRSSDAREAIYWCDHAFGPDSTQQSVYEKTAAPICEAVLEGYNGAVIAYGQTGSGKTHTIIGDENNRGVIVRSVATIFSALQARKHWQVEVCVLEIYNERTRDLLAAGQAVSQVDIHEVMNSDGCSSSFQCPDATRREVRNTEEAMAALLEGLRQRETATTDMNHTSSRSHLIFTLNLVQSDDALGATLRGRLHLVDLAGSERLKRSMASLDSENSKTPRAAIQKKEAGAINKSLSQLALVIYRLTTGSGARHVPYRDSMLTRLLADSFGGSSKTCLIITCSALVRDREETRCALEFGKRANLVKNVAQINIDLEQEPSDVVKALVAKELSELKLKHANLQSRVKEAVAEAVKQQKLRAREVRQLESDKADLQQRWLDAATMAAEVQEESAAEIARLREEQRALHQWLQDVAGELSRLEREKATLQEQLIEALKSGSAQAEAVQERAQEALSASARAQEWRAAIEETSTVRGAALRGDLEAARDEATRHKGRVEERQRAMDAEALEFSKRWGSLMPGEEGAEESTDRTDSTRLPGEDAEELPEVLHVTETF